MNFKCFLFTCMFLLIVSVAAVSAADLNESNIQTSNGESPVILSDNSDINPPPGTFDDLQVEINNALEGSVLDLTRDYKGHYGSRIIFNKNLTIDGHGHTLDCLNERGCSAFYSSSGLITLKNIKIINAYNDYNGKGGAIHIEGSAQYVLENCIFSNNWAKYSGGAIYNDNSNPLTLTNCQFKSNCADTISGGAIYSNGDVTIENSTFTSNKADFEGGALYSEGNVNVKGSLFDSNGIGYDFIFDSRGGAILAQRDVSIYNSTFRNNYVYDFGGAVYARRVNVDPGDCQSFFINNKAEDDDGGAIYAQEEVNVANAVFSGNSANKDGGAIFTNKWINVFNCLFDDNRAVGALRDYCCGGAIYAQDNVKIYESIFRNCYAEDGGAVYTSGDLSLDNSTFENNAAKNTGGAIFCEAININANQDASQAFNSFFKNNHADSNQGGALNIRGDSIILNAVFSSNKAYYLGGAILSKAGLNVNHCLFEDNRAEGSSLYDCRGGAICANTVDVLNSTFIRNYAEDYGGAIFAIGKININPGQDISQPYSTFFIDNTADDDNGGAIASDHVGNTQRGDNIDVVNAVFKSNKAKVDGGAIYTPQNVNVVHCLFESNKADGAKSKRCFGGAIRAEKEVCIDFSIFNNNYAENYGGAVYADTVEIKSSPSYFENNTAYKGPGGAIYTNKFTKDVKYATFIGNRAGEGATISDDGGAIYINKENWITFSNCVFVNNHCTDEGGAIYLDSSSSHLTLINNVFIGNTADDEGQCVFNKGYYDKINNNFWGGKNPSSDNDQLIEWKATIFQSNVHHSDSDPLKLTFNVNLDYRCGHPIIMAEAVFTYNNGNYYYGNLYDLNLFSFVADADLEVINYAEDLNRFYEELFPSDNGVYTITVKFYSYTISKKVNIENL